MAGIKCKFCGSPVGKNATFCSNCGKELYYTPTDVTGSTIIGDGSEIICKMCSEQIPRSAKKCPKCGARNDRLIYCKHCDAVVAREAKRCPKCGTRLKKPTWWIWVLAAVILQIVLTVVFLKTGLVDIEVLMFGDGAAFSAISVQAAKNAIASLL